MLTRIVTTTAALLCTSLVSCGSKQKPAEEASQIEVNNDDEFDEGMEMMQEFGGMNEEKVTKTFKRLVPDLSACLTGAGSDQDYLYGDVAFLVKVNVKGIAQAAHAERSNLGSYQAENCMLEVLKSTRWPKPVGGHIGLARNGMGYDAPGDVRPPVQWSASDVEETLQDPDNAEALRACGRGGPFEITAYIGTNGRVLSAGIAHSDDKGDATAACLIGAVEAMTFKSPGSWRAKVTFTP